MIAGNPVMVVEPCLQFPEWAGRIGIIKTYIDGLWCVEFPGESLRWFRQEDLIEMEVSSDFKR